jgi:sugar O-acyltransferase (sialic acid O-acetyltransferase NeuD family)
MTRPLVIFGSAEIARLARYYFENDSAFRVVAFAVDDEHVDASEIEGLPLLPFSEARRRFPAGDAVMHVALSYRGLNRLRQEKFEQVKAAGYELVSYVCSKSVTWPDRKIGENCFILENQTIQPTVSIGNNVMIWSGNHLGHGSSIGDHTYSASHVVISGHCKIGQRCFFGVNATLRDFLTVGDDVFVGMHAAVVQDVEAGSVVVGGSGEVFTSDDRRAKVLKKKYFGV